MYKILKAEKLADKIFLMDVHAPRVAKHCQPGQFVIVKMDDKGERIPLTICDYTKKDPFLVHAGEWVKFIPVSRREYDKIREADLRGNYHVKTYEKAVE